MKTPIIAIIGPTASGKTAYAIDLAHRMNGAIISADSRQVYAGMNMGTAKPSAAFSDGTHAPIIPETINDVPHYLLNIALPDRLFTLSDWLTAAQAALVEIRAHGQLPIIAGGTMLYVDALLDGYDVPNIEPNPDFRNTLEQEPVDVLYKKLQNLDPASCAFIEPHNTRRIIRALEVMQATGKKFSELRTASSEDQSTRIGIFPDWDAMRTRIQKRSKQMIQMGLVEEAMKLRASLRDSPLLQTINYKEALQIADGQLSEAEAIAKMTQVTLRYAHRQMSWWNRRSDIGWICIE